MLNAKSSFRIRGAKKDFLFSLALSTGLVCAAISSTASAIPVFGFEPGQIGWESIGDVSLQSASFGITPTEGSQQAVITTLCDATVVSWCETSLIEKPYSGVSSVPDVREPIGRFDGTMSAAQFLGMPDDATEFRAMFEQPPTPSGRGESGAIRLSFFASAGDAIEFDWNFISQGPDGDSAYFTLWSGTFRRSELLRDPIKGPFAGSDGFALSNVDLCSRQVGALGCDFFTTMETGYVTKYLSIEQDGWYSLGFGLIEIAEGTVPSALAIDNIRFVRVPEPDTTWLFVTSILCLALVVNVRHLMRRYLPSAPPTVPKSGVQSA